ncbi:MAG: DNA polymerase I [Gemmataceae bacterium]|nr:DNA polymerase I [Gemmataceae bacterium]MDW8266893.1 DNA polymerase I [Gemmataceae bacterium]
MKADKPPPTEGTGSKPPSPGSVFLVDTYSLLFQVFHALPPMSSPDGLPTNALFGLTKDLLFLRSELKPAYLLCVFDLPGPTFRNEIAPEYKAHRAPMPDDLQAQIPRVHELLEAMRLPQLSHPGYEADDVLATLAKAAAGRGLDVFICTNDKDCRQLIDDRIHLYNLRKRQVFGREELLADWGITPEQVVDLQALVGDPVDNVPGVPGIGVKTAAKLLKEFGTLDNLLAQLERISGAKTRESLRAAADTLVRSRQLVRLATDVPLAMDWEGWRLREWDGPRLRELFRRWGFRSFAAMVEESPTAGTRSGSATLPFRPTTDEGLSAAAEAAAADHRYHLVDTPEKFADFLRQLSAQRRLALDLETTSLRPREADIVGLAFCWQPGEAWYVAIRGPAATPVLEPTSTLDKLRPILENPNVAKVNQNIKYDLLVLRQHGIQLAGVVGDPMVADYLLHAGERSHNLDELAQRYFGHRMIPITDLIGKRGRAQKRMDEVPTAQVAEYAGEDADYAWRLCDRIEPELAQTDARLKRLYDELEVPLIEVLAELEFNGIRLDVPLLKRQSEEMTRQLVEIEESIHRLAGRPFNIASPKQLRDVLFRDLQLPTQRRTGTTREASTDQETLERLAALGHELPRRILEHRHLAKLKGTYVDALPALVNPQTGRIHASFNQTVAATGRLSSSDPNLQNIPVRSEVGRQIRQAFIPEEGWQLLTADYSQIELRMLAHFSGDAALRRAFAEDRDIHAAVAAEIFAIPEEAVGPEQRRVAKTVNFGVIYGMSAHGLAQRLAIPREEAARFIDAYFARYPQVLEHQSRLLAECAQTGFVRTILGRRRAIAGVRPESSYQQRNQPEREAINMEIQGSAADLIKLAMLHLYRRLRREKCRARLLLTVHDELVLEVPPEELAAVAEWVRHDMTTALELEVPLRVDLAVGPNWLDVAAWRPTP